MIVSYDNQAMRILALSSAEAAAQLGESVAAWLHALLAEIEAAGDASELLSLYGKSARVADTFLVINVASGFSAIFAVVGDKGILDAHGVALWSAIRRLKLVQVDVGETGG